MNDNAKSIRHSLFAKLHQYTGQSSAFTTPNTSSRIYNTQLNMAKISSVKAREILDSRGNPTVEVCFVLVITYVMHVIIVPC